MEGKFRNKYRIGSTRKPGRDYGMPGFYFITICTKNRICHFGNVVNGVMVLSDIGRIVVDEWKKTAMIRPNVVLDEWVVMPNHVHMIIRIVENNNKIRKMVTHSMATDVVETPRTVETPCRASLRTMPTHQHNTPPHQSHPPYRNTFGPQRNNISSIMCGFKAVVTKRTHVELHQWNFAWQPRFHDRIIRTERELSIVRQYIINNPSKWNEDSFYDRA